MSESSSGISKHRIEALTDGIYAVAMTLLVIEHVMRAVMALSQRVVVINTGKPVCQGTPEEVVRDPRVLDCYLGQEKL